MPVSRRSRYARTPLIAADGPDRTARAVITRRQTPATPSDAQVYHHLLSAEENIEYLAWRYLDRSEDWWRIADANPTAYPLDLRPGSSLNINLSSEAGRVERTRRF